MDTDHEITQTKTPAPRQGVWRSDFVCFTFIFMLLALAACAPVFLHPARHLEMLPEGDKGTNLWNLWWVYYALFVRGISPLRCDLIFFPWGCDLRFHTLSLTNGILAAPVTALAGPVVAYNFLFVLWTILTGSFAAMWAREWGAQRGPAVLVGILATFGPYRWAHLNHLNLFSTAWIFCACWVLEKGLKTPRKRDVLSLFVVWVLAFFTDWYYGLFIGLYGVARVGMELFRAQTRKMRFRMLGLFVIPALAVGMALSFYFAPSSELERYVDPVDMTFSAYWSMDLLHFFVPIWLLKYFPSVQQNREFFLHPGWCVLFPSIYFGWKYGKTDDQRRQRRMLLILTGLFGGLALGPILVAGGKSVEILGIPIFLPTAIFEIIPALTVMRVYARFAYLGFTCFCLLGALGAQAWLLERRISKKSIFVLGSLFIAVFALESQWKPPRMLEYSAPFDLFPLESGPVLEVPFTPSVRSGLHLFHQTIHHQPIFVVEFSRLGRYRQAYLTAFPALDLINRASLGKAPFLDPGFSPEDFCDKLQELGPVHLILSLPESDPRHAEKNRDMVRSLLKPCQNRFSEYYSFSK